MLIREWVDFLGVLYRRGAFHIMLSTFANKFVVFFGTVVVVRLLSKEEYGLVSYVENIYGYVMIFAGWGLANGLLRYVVLAAPAQKGAYFHYVLRGSLVRNALLAALLLAGNACVTYPLEFAAARDWVPVMALLLPLQDLVKDGRFALRAVFCNQLYANLTLLLTLGLLLGRVAGAWLAGVGGVLWSRVLVNGGFAVAAVWLAWRAIRSVAGQAATQAEAVTGAAGRGAAPTAAETRTTQSVQAVPLTQAERRELNVYSAQYMLTNGLWALFLLNDTFLLGWLGPGPQALAEYKAALVVPGVLALLANAIGMFLTPYFTRHEQERAWLWRRWQQSLAVTAGLTGLAALLLALLAEPLIAVVYGPAYASIAPLLRLLVGAQFIYSGLGYITVTLLAAVGEIRWNIRISLVGMVLQVLVGVTIIPSYGAYGAAVANAAAFALMVVLVTWAFVRRYRART